MRIVSLLPSATEILFALGLDHQVVGVSHECDYPPQVCSKRVVINSRIPHGISSGEIDRLVREYVSRGESLYSVDAAALEELAPDLIVTQDLCHVCAASPGDLGASLTRLPRQPRVLSLNPRDIADVWDDIRKVGEATGRADRARELLAQLDSQLSSIERCVSAATERPRVALLEWLDPFYVGGHWVPEMIARAGGIDALGEIRKPSFRLTHEQVIAAAAEILLIAPCGYSAEQARNEYLSTSFPSNWSTIPAVRDHRVFALEANSYFSRPGPRLVTGVATLVNLFHPAAALGRDAASATLPIAAAAGTPRSASNPIHV